MKVPRPLLLALALLPGVIRAQAETKATLGVIPGQRGTVQFKESPPQSADAEQVKFRVHSVETPPPYEVAKETFEILVPKGYHAKDPHGLFIWIPAGDSATLPKEWEAVLAREKLIFISARKSGNSRSIFDRMRMAVDANHNLRQFYAVDGRRVYVAGFSGGGRVASMLGVCWGEMFSGALCFMGANFYTDVTGEDGKVYSLNYLPDDEVLALAKKYCRYALITGEKDFNLANTRAVAKAFEKEGFARAQLFEAPGTGHALPSAEWLEKALAWLDEGRR